MNNQEAGSWEWGRGMPRLDPDNREKGLACPVVLASALPTSTREHEGPGHVPNTHLQ